MPSYRFTGGYPRALVGLSEGVNAHHEGTPPGATIEAHPGDEVTTSVPYAHAEMELVDEAAQPDLTPAPAPAPVAEPTPAPVQSAAEPVAEPITLTADEVAHLTPEVLAQIHAAEDPNPSAPAPETQE